MNIVDFKLIKWTLKKTTFREVYPTRRGAVIKKLAKTEVLRETCGALEKKNLTIF